MFSIGEFSKITGLSVKTLRFYHEQGLLAPSSIGMISKMLPRCPVVNPPGENDVMDMTLI